MCLKCTAAKPPCEQDGHTSAAFPTPQAHEYKIPRRIGVMHVFLSIWPLKTFKNGLKMKPGRKLCMTQTGRKRQTYRTQIIRTPVCTELGFVTELALLGWFASFIPV